MKKLTKQEGQSPAIALQNIEKLKQLFPDLVTEGKIDFDAFRESFGEFIDEREERYSFTWHGKSRARQIAQTPSAGTLLPCPEESVNWDKTKNIFIEGDNLEALKLLQKSYHREVKMIYIDPPYNTGKEFIYPDKYQDNLDTYLKYTGQVDAEGLKLSANSEVSGRYHTNWLNMMYPRLKLARNLLRDDGLIFVSIDDNEVHNLRHLLDEIFGPENFQGHIHWRRRHNQPNDPSKMIALVAEHVLAYARDSAAFKEAGVGKIALTGSFTNPDNDARGPWASKPWKVGSGQSGSRYKIRSPEGRVFDESWMGEQSTFQSLAAESRIVWPKGKSGHPRKKYYEKEREAEGQCATNWWPHDRFGHNQGASSRLAELMGEKQVFDNPKPVELILNLMNIANVKAGDTILDFFAGSATTFEAVLEHGHSARSILVQLPEQLEASNSSQSTGLAFCEKHRIQPNIAALSRERMRRAGNAQEAGDDNDVGFRVFKLANSNIKTWDADFENVGQQLFDAIDNIKPERSQQDVLFELLLKYGLDLSTITEERLIEGKKVFVVGAGALVVCIAPAIALDVVQGIADLKTELAPEVMRVVFRDSGFENDVVKANAVQVLKQSGIEDVKSL